MLRGGCDYTFMVEYALLGCLFGSLAFIIYYLIKFDKGGKQW